MTATAASSSSARAVVTGTGPTAAISQRSPGFVCPRASAALSTVTRTSTGLHGPSVAHQRVGGVGGPGLVTPRAPGVAEDPVDVGLPRRVEPRPGIRRHPGVEAGGAAGTRPLVGPPLHMQAPRPRPVVGLGPGTHEAGLV